MMSDANNNSGKNGGADKKLMKGASPFKELLDQLPQNTRKYLTTGDPKMWSFVNAFIQGYAGTIKICNPIDCEFRNCPLKAANVAPDGNFCPLDIIYVDHHLEIYKNNFDLVTAADIIRVIDLVTTQLLQNRALASISNEGLLIDTPKVVIQKDGKVVNAPEAHPLLDVYNKLQQAKERILKALSKDKNEGSDIIDTIYKVIGDDSDESDDDERKNKYDEFFGGMKPTMDGNEGGEQE